MSQADFRREFKTRNPNPKTGNREQRKMISPDRIDGFAGKFLPKAKAFEPMSRGFSKGKKPTRASYP